MPFTLAHPALILPLNQSKHFSLTALIVGSMVPDLEFFFQLREVPNIGHHWYGIIIFDFPAVLLCCFLYHNLLRNALVIHLPQTLVNKISRIIKFDWNNFALHNKWKVSYSIFLGIASHIIWDDFTHYDGHIVQLLPFLSNTINLFGHQMHIYYLLQILFSGIGIIAMLYFIWQLPLQRSIIYIEKNRWYWPVFVLTFLLILTIRIIAWPQYNSFWSVVLAIMGSFCYSWIFVSILFKIYFLKNISL